MDVYPLRRCSKQMVESMVSSISLYRQIKHEDPEQFDLLMQYSQIVEIAPQESIIESDQIDTWLYFLFKGQLAVYSGEPIGKKVNTISPGQMFGDMAVLMHQPRSATVKIEEDCKLATVLRTDFSIFGEPEEVQNVSLPTKLLFYRAMVHNLRWRVESYRSDYPSVTSIEGLSGVTLYTGAKDTMDELLNLDVQAQQLSAILEQWNEVLEAQ